MNSPWTREVELRFLSQEAIEEAIWDFVYDFCLFPTWYKVEELLGRYCISVWSKDPFIRRDLYDYVSQRSSKWLEESIYKDMFRYSSFEDFQEAFSNMGKAKKRAWEIIAARKEKEWNTFSLTRNVAQRQMHALRANV